MFFSEYIKRYGKILSVLICALILLGYLTYSFVSPHGRLSDVHNDLKSIKPDIEYAYTDLDGNVVDIRDFKGKPLIINSWATWTPFSQAELVTLSSIVEEYKTGITVLAINRMEHSSIIQSFVDTFEIGNSIKVLVDPTDYFYKAVGGYAMPETLIYDSEGVLVEHIRGTFSEDVLRERIRSLVK